MTVGEDWQRFEPVNGDWVEELLEVEVRERES
jgi:hypothetical protein